MALAARRKPALPVVDIARRLARDASRAVELVVFAIRAITAAVEATALGARFPASLGLLPEALVARRKPALPLVDIARRLARDASWAVEWVVFAVHAITAAEEAGAPGARLPADLGLLPEALVIMCKPALPVVDIARRLARDASRAVEWVVFAVRAMVYPVASMFAFRFRIQPRPSKTTNASPWLWV